MQYLSIIFSLLLGATAIGNANAFAPVGFASNRPTVAIVPIVVQKALFSRATVVSRAQGEGDETTPLLMSVSDQTLLGAAGTFAALITLYSEFVLKTTGCGLPAGPLGLIGAIEGVSYLGIVGVTAYSLYTKFKTGRGLPPGPAGVLGAAEGLSYLAIAVGLVVLVLQVLNYGYIPNAVPMEKGMCS